MALSPSGVWHWRPKSCTIHLSILHVSILRVLFIFRWSSFYSSSSFCSLSSFFILSSFFWLSSFLGRLHFRGCLHFEVIFLIYQLIRATFLQHQNPTWNTKNKNFLLYRKKTECDTTQLCLLIMPHLYTVWNIILQSWRSCHYSWSYHNCAGPKTAMPTLMPVYPF